MSALSAALLDPLISKGFMSPEARKEEETVTKDGYELTFYPGFVSRVTVRGDGGAEHELYKQRNVYHLPKGQAKPRTKHKLRLKGGKKKQNITLDIDDPELRIARITVELYGEDHQPGGGETEDVVVETMEVQNFPKTCPPWCGSDE
ncbi:MAG: hypothetical protein H0X65_05950 [Gemmatimonadetes bacterium]|nr:hypothetical protein [Gemmatimonadota bacterium]